MTIQFTCERCGKHFSTQHALTIHSEVKRENGTLATMRVLSRDDEVSHDSANS